MPRIYLDHAATTPVDEAVTRAMVAVLENGYGNPSSVHAPGREARQRVSEAREKVAQLLGARPEEIVFTSGGTEADNLALVGVARACRERGDHIVTTQVEHHAVLETCRALEAEGFRTTYVPVDSHGMVDPQAVAEALTPRTVLVSVMLANNEVGTLQPVARIADLVRPRGVYLHTDAVQAVGQVPVAVEELGVDLLSLSAHKMYGPKGVGALYVRRGVPLSPLLHGGGQERGRRSGTENVPGIVGLGKAAQLAHSEQPERQRGLTALRERLIRGLASRVPEAILNGHPTQRLPSNVSISFPGVTAEALVVDLDLKGVAISAGAACAAGTVEPSHVLRAMGLSESVAAGTVRLSLGRANTPEEVDQVLDILTEAVERLRQAS